MIDQTKAARHRGEAAGMATLVTGGAVLLLPVVPLLAFLLLWPGVLLSTVTGIGHAEGTLLAIPASWVVYYWIFGWLLRRVNRPRSTHGTP